MKHGGKERQGRLHYIGCKDVSSNRCTFFFFIVFHCRVVLWCFSALLPALLLVFPYITLILWKFFSQLLYIFPDIMRIIQLCSVHVGNMRTVQNVYQLENVESFTSTVVYYIHYETSSLTFVIQLRMINTNLVTNVQFFSAFCFGILDYVIVYVCCYFLVALFNCCASVATFLAEVLIRVDSLIINQCKSGLIGANVSTGLYQSSSGHSFG